VRAKEIRERKRGQRPHRVLVEATVAHLREAPQHLDDVKRMLTARADPRAFAVERIAFGCAFAALIDQVLPTQRLVRLAIRLFPVGLVAMPRFLEAVHPRRQLPDGAASVMVSVCTKPCGSVPM
jgi:hypothetical protein